MATSTVEIMNRGMRCLTEQMGIVEAEQFISLIIREKFDYTKWQREYFDAKSPEKISSETSYFETVQPFLTQSTISSWYRKDMLPTLPSLIKICDAFINKRLSQ